MPHELGPECDRIAIYGPPTQTIGTSDRRGQVCLGAPMQLHFRAFSRFQSSLLPGKRESYLSITSILQTVARGELILARSRDRSECGIWLEAVVRLPHQAAPRRKPRLAERSYVLPLTRVERIMIIDTSLDPKPSPQQTRKFRRYEPAVRFTPDQSRRQNALLRGAWDSFKSKDAVIAFLNTYNADLGGEPLAVALASDDGLQSAEQLLASLPKPVENLVSKVGACS